MSVEQAQRTVNQLHKDIADLEKKMAGLVKKEADKTKRIGVVQKSITKNTSVSMLKNKDRQIQGYQRDLARLISDKASINNKMAEKRAKLAQTTVKLQKEESSRAKNIERQQNSIYETYEKQIAELSEQVKLQEKFAISDKNVFDSSTEEEYDVFVSHATEDKDSFCDEFVNILKNEHHLNVWYDSLNLKWGDNIRTEIDKGLIKSKFGVVILSKSYIKKYWTNYELEGIIQQKNNIGKQIPPIRHDITKQEIQNFSPSLAGKMSMNTAIMTPSEIAEKLNELYSSSKERPETER